VIKMEDFRREDGNVDWPEYRKARVAAGEECPECSGFNPHAKGAGPQLCYDCRSLREDRGEVSHDRCIRCPKCGEVRDEDLPGDDGSHEMSCDSCGHDYTIKVLVSWTYVSPPMEDDPESES
jgi:hypothetical protein